MSYDIANLLTEMLEVCRKETLATAAEVREENRLAQLKEAKAHPLWLVGHLANTIDVVGNVWTYGSERVTPPEFGRLFAPHISRGAPVSARPEDYPAWEGVLGEYEKAMDSFLENISQTTDSEMDDPPRGPLPEDRKNRFTSIKTDIQIMIFHDNYHRGQLGLLSKPHS